VVGYYPGWQWYDRGQLVNPFTINYSKYTILNYAFFNPNPDGTITGLDPWADENILLGQINWSTDPVSHYPNTGLIDRAHNEGVKVLISVGGWTLSTNFSAIAADPVKRQQFAEDCAELVSYYNLDGIDIDWEYPGFAEHGGTPADGANYILLLQEVRSKLDQLEVEMNEEYIITAALPAGISHMENIDWNGIVPLLDLLNIMTYDFNGTWNSECNHNAPLYLPSTSSPQFSCHDAITALINTYNVPAEKMVLGIPFYGRSMKTIGTPELFAPVQNGSADNSTFWADEGSPLYYNILLQQYLFTNHWDEISQVPYLTGNGMLNTFVSYDDVNSVELKADYIIEHGLAGAIIWEITGDYIETFPGSGVVDETPLATALNNALCQNSICLGDFNNDQLRNTSDLLIMIGYLGQNCGSPYCSGDLSGDAIVNVSDLLLMMSLFGTECL
jgi:chitinase